MLLGPQGNILMATAGVIAGTPIDTALGVRYLERLGFSCLSYPAGRNPKEQSFLQNHHSNFLQQVCLRKAQEMAQAGAQFVLIYCNSLSASLDLEALRKHLQIPLVTPMDVYQAIAIRYQRFAIVAANAIGLMGAEGAIKRLNPHAFTFGYHNIEIVRRIEQQHPAAEIVKDSGLPDFLDLARTEHADLLLLACTHYPYLTSAIQAMSAVPVMDIDMGLHQAIDLSLRAAIKPTAPKHDVAN